MRRELAPLTRPQPFLCLLPVALALVHPSGPASAQSTVGDQEVSDTLLIQQAGLRRVLETIDEHQLGPLKTVCLLIQSRDEPGGWGETNENRPPLERFLQEEFRLRTRPRSGCVSGEGSTRPGRLFRDSETGEAAAFLHLSVPNMSCPDAATVDVGFGLGPLWGRGQRCELRRGEGKWSIVACRDTWIS